MRIEIQNGLRIICGHIFPANEIFSGEKWMSSGNSVVTIDRVEDGDVYYYWYENGVKKEHDKDSFSFQCRYCKIVEVGSNISRMRVDHYTQMNAYLPDALKPSQGDGGIGEAYQRVANKIESEGHQITWINGIPHLGEIDITYRFMYPFEFSAERISPDIKIGSDA